MNSKISRNRGKLCKTSRWNFNDKKTTIKFSAYVEQAVSQTAKRCLLERESEQPDTLPSLTYIKFLKDPASWWPGQSYSLFDISCRYVRFGCGRLHMLYSPYKALIITAWSVHIWTVLFVGGTKFKILIGTSTDVSMKSVISHLIIMIAHRLTLSPQKVSLCKHVCRVKSLFMDFTG